ncbi:MAG: hypothetical protein DPW18_04470 [Chloroflexi bacterium]|nr:hypothetical protein [Chloroflexota bacterium]MDL1943479.1 hypothetical protein [Chloroflexi bacterium CFX2]NOH03262.1 hypothetical protein [Chloroflexota bacterium]
MKKVLLLTLALLLAGCGVVQPAQQVQPTPVIQTVVVTVIPPTEAVPPTSISLPTQAPTDVPTLAPTATLEPTATPQPTATTGDTSGTGSSGSDSGLKPVNVDNVLGKGVFTNIVISNELLTLRCFPREIEFTMTANLPEITRAEMYYRIVDQPSALYPSEWQLVGNLGTDGKGNFFITFSGEDINPNFRGLEKAWIDFQFIGINKGGGVVGRTEKIERLVEYSKECP